MRGHPEVLQVVGAPVVDLKGKWKWPCKGIRRQYWKIHYADMPTGHARVDVEKCFVADSTSGTRVLRSDIASKLARSTLKRGRSMHGSILVEIDLLLKFVKFD